MPSYVLKAEPDSAIYVGWSTIVDNATWVALDRAEALRCPEVTADRLERADEHGTSCRALPPDGWRPGGWGDDLIVTNMETRQGFALLTRSDLAEYARFLAANDATAAEAMLKHLPEDDD